MSTLHMKPVDLTEYDGLLVDIDGTILSGRAVIPHAQQVINSRQDVFFATNNASRSPEEVADHLRTLGFHAAASRVTTSATVACELGMNTLREEHPDRDPSGFRAYVIGADSFRQLAAAAGFHVVDSADDRPDVVFHGHSPENNWRSLSEGALAIRNGALYLASNLDTTLPTERGLMVGNGSMVAAVRSATGVSPISAGKPAPAMFHHAAAQLGAQRPLVIGDRLDTDIAGGRAAGYDTLCVLTGVSTHYELLTTPHRPTYIAPHLGESLSGWGAELDPATATLRVSSGLSGTPEENAAAAVAVVAPIMWASIDAGADTSRITVEPVDEIAGQALAAWRS